MRAGRKSLLKTRVARKKNAPIRTWEKTGLRFSDRYGENIFIVIIDKDIDMESKEYAEVERAIQKAGAEIIEKSSDKFRDSVVVRTSDPLALQSVKGVDIVTRRPKAKALIDGVDDVIFPTTGGSCSVSQASKQAAIVDVANGRRDVIQNNGGNVIVVVWDFFPKDVADLSRDELVDRPGGGVFFVDSPKDAGDTHGGAVASTCCGKNVGLASGASVILLQLSNNVTNDLSVIDSICDSHTDKPVVVNMSFAFIWSNQSSGAAQAATRQSIRDLDDILEEMKQRHPRLLFVVAGGNESLNPCDTTGGVTYGSGDNRCTDCYFWPQSRIGEAYSTTDVPFVLVGASAVYDDTPQQRIASYSNFGACMHTYTHGSVVCALNSDSGEYIGINGTSFSAPVFTSLAAMRWSQSPDSTADDVVAFLMANTEDTLDLSAAAESAGTIARFSSAVESLKTGGAEPTPLEGDIGGIMIGTRLASPTTVSLTNILFVLALLLVVFGGLYFARSRK